jgi:aspartate/methionine/tyrosine aminotransferase
MLIFNSGCNPTGVVYTQEEVCALLEEAKRHNLTVLSDEVYSGLVYDEMSFSSCGSFPEHEDHVIVVQSCSKHFGMTGWRVGFVFARAPVIRSLAAFQGRTTTGVAYTSQWAAIGALEHANEVNDYVKAIMRKRREVAVQTCNELFHLSIDAPPSSLYLFVPLTSFDPESIESSVEFCERLLNEGNIGLVPGAAFGVEGYVRIAFTLDEPLLKEALQMLHRAASSGGR